jgi:acyl-CoA reductase-like NAD-dependent aldehyde dehydrogenase
MLVASRRIFVNFKSRNAGQVCVSPTRFFVQESIYQRFADSFAEKAAQLKVGDGLDPKMQIGPLANSRRIDMMEALVAYAFTRSSNNAHRPANDVEAGNLSINHFVASVAETPFGGVKDSGYGREGGTEGLSCYTVAKNVSHKMLSPQLPCVHNVTSPALGAP